MAQGADKGMVGVPQGLGAGSLSALAGIQSCRGMTMLLAAAGLSKGGVKRHWRLHSGEQVWSTMSNNALIHQVQQRSQK